MWERGGRKKEDKKKTQKISKSYKRELPFRQISPPKSKSKME
jgi:hypothetical protein